MILSNSIQKYMNILTVAPINKSVSETLIFLSK